MRCWLRAEGPGARWRALRFSYLPNGEELLFTGHRGSEAELDSNLVARASYDSAVAKIGPKVAAALSASHQSWPELSDGTFVVAALTSGADS
ncbi:MAG: hypothetical protein JRI23_27325 [Deltaproteobacteria bacterium]|jgi:hypothetical protein|nr:hypothetical protein [Deltaproteobacteria bacterium]MBW2535791.1 hypothetical protein [Deltaproteobacteria bacterium]